MMTFIAIMGLLGAIGFVITMVVNLFKRRIKFTKLAIGLALSFAAFIVGVVNSPTPQTSTSNSNSNSNSTKSQQPKQVTPQKTVNMAKLVHLDGVKGLPSYTVHVYHNGDSMPAYNGTEITCTHTTEYQVVFNVKGSGLNPTPEYNNLVAKLQPTFKGETDNDNVTVSYVTADYGSITTKWFGK